MKRFLGGVLTWNFKFHGFDFDHFKYRTQDFFLFSVKRNVFNVVTCQLQHFQIFELRYGRKYVTSELFQSLNCGIFTKKNFLLFLIIDVNDCIVICPTCLRLQNTLQRQGLFAERKRLYLQNLPTVIRIQCKFIADYVLCKTKKHHLA